MADPMNSLAGVTSNRPPSLKNLFAIAGIQGTARDTSLLMDYLGAFVFPSDDCKITENLVLGVSLGGHAAWSCLLHEPRVSGGVVIIGCPDYLNLMTDRASLSKLPSWTKSSPPGSQILYSEAFPRSFVDLVKQYDPASLLLSRIDCGKASLPVREGPLPHPTEREQQMPSRQTAGLRTAVSFEDIVDENARHEVTPRMAEDVVRFIVETLADTVVSNRKISLRDSKI
ncbi:hypothetical protein PENSUB_1500 [Penicillium subrubescens]|uniref:AB hydrolase-1 domain-containing protein n=2 Tax=Penicillium subrubescens TaxID=1316194 RepID=A0A1Q5UJU5_9EURO|nr:hypothetical protein PENSUB_1500 [Penicillium subrubescens]